jgi:hypothetical protein
MKQSDGVADMQVSHTYRRETYGKNAGQAIATTQCTYLDSDGTPMMSSFHGHLHPQIAENMLKAYRAEAKRAESA